MTDTELRTIRTRLNNGDPDEITTHAADDLQALLAETDRARAAERLARRLFCGKGVV